MIMHGCTLPHQANNFFAALPWEIMHPILREHYGGHRFQSDENVETTMK
jgi:hypothetical protein